MTMTKELFSLLALLQEFLEWTIFLLIRNSSAPKSWCQVPALTQMTLQKHPPDMSPLSKC
jgi:hypothetical protein